MNTVKHTPKPWWRDDDGFIAAGSGETHVIIADADCSDMDIDEREANKALMIAAPELLEMLKTVVDRRAGGTTRHVNIKLKREQWFEICAAIAKAEGREA